MSRKATGEANPAKKLRTESVLVDPRRCRTFGKMNPGSGPVVYWMSRDQRVEDNWALLKAQELSQANDSTLHVLFCLDFNFPLATLRSFDFMLRGLEQVQKDLTELKIPFHLQIESPSQGVPKFIEHHQITELVTDYSPLRVKKEWLAAIEAACGKAVRITEVDAHNVVPVRVTSPKQEWAARTIRPKIHKHLPEFLVQFPPLQAATHSVEPPAINWAEVHALMRAAVDTVVPLVPTEPGGQAAKSALDQFLQRLESYEGRNDPTAAGQSGLSPYLHFGQIAAQRVILEAMAKRKGHETPVDSFVEEALVRRELSDNFCEFNADYDKFAGFPEWARTSLDLHRKDKRDYLYTYDQWELGQTHDQLWNAAQKQLVVEGKMHGFLRMYWAKKILEWSSSPEEALDTALKLNDRFSIDGRDPNGFVGCAWSIGGVHDQGWTERPVFGKIRFMNYAGCKRKFNVPEFERRWAAVNLQKILRHVKP